MSVTVLAVLCVFIAVVVSELSEPSGSNGTNQQCVGGEPMENLRYGVDTEFATAKEICCHNHRYAERPGFLQWSNINLFGKIDENKRTVFYDSQCGKPLFVAPVGRSFEKFREETIAHGWPSFRPEETVAENVKVLEGGRMESVCGTHLGHNIPDSAGARYCIDLVCVAGTPTTEQEQGFDAYNFTHDKAVSQPAAASGSRTHIPGANSALSIAAVPLCLVTVFCTTCLFLAQL